MAEIKPFTGIGDRVLLSQVVPLSTPFTINIFPTNVCNFKCNYCAQSRDSEAFVKEYGVKKEIMSLHTVGCIADQILEFPDTVKLVSMMGHGEPLCNRELPLMIQTLKSQAGSKIGRIDVISNASLLTPEYSQSLIDAGLDVLRVSLQGITSQSYSKISGVNLDFESLYENLAWFYAHRGTCKLYVKTMDVSLAPGEEKQFYDLFSNICDRMFIDRVKPVYDTVSYTDEQRDTLIDRYGISHAHRSVCPQPFYMLSVWPDGMVTPCDALYHASPLGNVHEQHLREMWNSSEHCSFCRMQLSKLRHQHSACSRCCAPDDVAHPEDLLDDYASELLSKYDH